MFKKILSYILPKKCISCTEYIDESSDFCSSCWYELSFANQPWCKICGSRFEYNIDDDMICGLCIQESPPFDIARHLFIYNTSSKKLVHDFKFCDKTSLASVYSRLMLNKYQKEIQEYDYIVPVPMHPLKRMFRMYNQAQLLALYLSKISDVPMYYVLKKTKWTKSQSSLSAKARKDNLRSSIEVISKDNIRGKSVLLIDDVYTTGTTVKLCSKILKKAGVKKVMVLTIGKTYKNST